MATQKLEFSKVPNSNGSYYYAPQIPVNGLPEVDFAPLKRLKEKKVEEEQALMKALPKFLSESIEKLKKLIFWFDVETLKKTNGESRLQNLKREFEELNSGMARSNPSDVNALLASVNQAVKHYEEELEFPSRDPNTMDDISQMSRDEIRERLGDVYYKNRGIVLTELYTIKNNFSGLVGNLNYVEERLQDEEKNVKNQFKDYFKAILIAEFNKAIDAIKTESDGANLRYRGSENPGIGILCSDLKLDKYRDDENGVQVKIAQCNSLENWQDDSALRPFIQKIQAVHTAYHADLKKIPALVQKYSQPKDKIFLQDLPKFPPFKALIDRIPEIQKRIDDDYFWQDRTKNRTKQTLLIELDRMTSPESTSSLQDIYNFMKDKQPKITRSTRSDEGCTATWFRNKPESENLFRQILADFDHEFPELQKAYEKAQGEAQLPSSSSSTSEVSTSRSN